MSIAPGTRLGQYEVQDFIGQGAMGLVYRAYHAQLERTGAVKVMQAISPDPDTTARFRHEAQAIAQMRHPNILNVYDFGEFEGTPYMIVEYVSGGSLANRLSQGMIDQAAALNFLRGIAAGLDYAHSRGVVHRDIKPANVLLEPDDTPVIADFGLAKLLQGSSLKSMTGVTTGTPAYMAPEQVTGSQVGPAADRYSLATIAYEMLTGVIPFDGEALMELLYAQVHREPPPPSSRNHSLGPRVDAVMMRALAKDPKARWESCTAFVRGLEEALAPRPAPAVARTMVMASPVASTAPLAAAGAGAAAVEAMDADEPVALAYPSPPPPVVKKKSRKGLFALTASVIVLILALVGWGIYEYLNQPVQLNVTPSSVVAGDSIVVTASHLPANQAGEIQVWSQRRIIPFQAGPGGSVVVQISIPRDLEVGDHLVMICWNGTCHSQRELRVLAPVALATPIASTSPSPAASSSPSPGPSPSPIATPAASLSIAKTSVPMGATIYVYGVHFSSSRAVTIALFDPASSTLALESWSALTTSSGGFGKSIKLPATALAGNARITACDSDRVCATAYLRIT
ncbi:MAG TPA: protein kinase [Candidatus Baltobacterales bacterium]|nr:protein kinase [Candidatus Baltobacterales bacterium]